MLRFGTDGVRGRAFTELTPSDVTALGQAVADVLGHGPWVVARDTRTSGPALVDALVAGLGDGAIDLGVLPTPALAFWSHRLGVPGAMVTASHNPWHDNGVKILAAGGTKLPDDVERAIEHRWHGGALAPGGAEPVVSGSAAPAVPDAVGAVDAVDAAEIYVDHLVAAAASLHSLHVVVDCANGAMSTVAPEAFRRLGARVTVIHATPDGHNINEACGATAPASLAHTVVDVGADLGLAFDGDGDRVIAVDHLGAVVDGDRLIALAALQLRAAGELVSDTVVVTVMSNLGFRRAMERAGITVVETAVGDRYVLEALDRGGYSIGGEQSGHIIYRRSATTGDGLLAGLRLAQHVVEQARPLAELAGAVMTSYPQVLLNVHVAERRPHVADELAAEITAAEAELGDDGRVLVRASGTEPLVRVMVEAASHELADTVATRLAEAARARFGSH